MLLYILVLLQCHGDTQLNSDPKKTKGKFTLNLPLES